MGAYTCAHTPLRADSTSTEPSQPTPPSNRVSLAPALKKGVPALAAGAGAGAAGAPDPSLGGAAAAAEEAPRTAPWSPVAAPGAQPLCIVDFS